MDVFSLINSKDIREYLRNKDYKFNSLETAWLIFQCHRLSYEEKKLLWQELIQTMLDCGQPPKGYDMGWTSLHKSLNLYMETLDQKIQKFLQDEPIGKYVYMYNCYCRDDERYSEGYLPVYPTLEKCMDAFHKEVVYMNEGSTNENGEVLRYKFLKQSLDNPDELYEMEYRGDGQVLEIDEYSPVGVSVPMHGILNFFDNLWFDFPTPFKKGDILWIPNTDDNPFKHSHGGFVLNKISTWNTTDFIKQNGCSDDMDASVYLADSLGGVFREVVENYMDFEYYEEPFKMNEQFFYALSSYLKGKIGEDALLRLYRERLLEVVIADDIEIASWEEDGRYEGLI